MKRKIIQIQEDKCNGCAACAEACHEGAIAMVNGKAQLMRDDYCDGLGDCLPACPAQAISFVVREAAAYDEQAMQENKSRSAREDKEPCMAHSCPGTKAQIIPMPQALQYTESSADQRPSYLSQWPVQIQLAPVQAPYFDQAKLLIAADCTAYAYAPFHEIFIKGRVALVGCPKLDPVDYSPKLTEILRQNDIRNVTIVRMEVPCCGGLEAAAKRAIQASGKFLPWQVRTISLRGEILD